MGIRQQHPTYKSEKERLSCNSVACEVAGVDRRCVSGLLRKREAVSAQAAEGVETTFRKLSCRRRSLIQARSF